MPPREPARAVGQERMLEAPSRAPDHDRAVQYPTEVEQPCRCVKRDRRDGARCGRRAFPWPRSSAIAAVPIKHAAAAKVATKQRTIGAT